MLDDFANGRIDGLTVLATLGIFLVIVFTVCIAAIIVTATIKVIIRTFKNSSDKENPNE